MDELLATTARGWADDSLRRSKDRCAADPLALTLVAGIGSPHGDDRVGWNVVETLQKLGDIKARFVLLRDGSDLVGSLEKCRRLIIVDACRSELEIGSITRLRWPDPRIVEHSHSSMHGVSICEALRLAHSLGRMPAVIDVIAIEVGDCAPGRDLSPRVLKAALKVQSLIAKEVNEEAYA